MVRALAVLSILASSITPAAAQDLEKVKLGNRARAFFQEFCHKCHKGSGSPGGEFDFLDFAALRTGKAEYEGLVKPGKSADSAVVVVARKGLAGDGEGMPPKSNTGVRPAAADVDALAAWIDAGCPDGAAAAVAVKRTPIDQATAYRAMTSYLTDLVEEEHRPYVRFFTLTHLHNDPRVKEADLQNFRAALGAAVNGLSWQHRLVRPAQVDPAQTIFAIDIRDAGWDPLAGWEKMLGYYPYGLSYANKGMPLAGLQRDLQGYTNTAIPAVRADWFAAVATQPPIYHLLLRLPQTLPELEHAIGVDAAENFRRDRIARGGVIKSGVSQAHRMVERHDAKYGAYWRSYDFKPANRRANLLQFPLGPRQFAGNPFQNPFAARAFEPDGGEVIFNLPNGLQAYLLVDGAEKRIDRGPSDVVEDANRVTGGAEVVNGISCMACHARGIKRFTDVIRERTSANGRDLRKVELIFPLARRMTALLDEDEDRFVRAMSKVVEGYLPAGGPKAPGYADPAGWACVRYNRPLDLDTAASELGAAPDTLLRELGVRGLGDLDVGPLAHPGGEILRKDWDTRTGIRSAFQNVAKAARIAEPLSIAP